MAKPQGTYKFAYDPADINPAFRIETHERLAALQFEALNTRLDRIETAMARMDRRVWVMVYGVFAVVLTQATQSFWTAHF